LDVASVIPQVGGHVTSLSLSVCTHSTWAVVGSPSTTTGSIETRGLSAPKNLIIIRANALLWLVHMYICIYVRFWTCILPIECCAVGLFGWRRLSLWSVGGCPSLVSQGQGDIQEEEVPFFFFFVLFLLLVVWPPGWDLSPGRQGNDAVDSQTTEITHNSRPSLSFFA
jgi:hypothetical protein